jgi:benzoyl-CoA reductase/2-hydroxyglutaryl-CoA dehydratase subunit BcrC/BadD/HgdB
MERMMNVPTFSFDYPFRRDDRAHEYIGKQIDHFIKFMEDFTGTKLD